MKVLLFLPFFFASCTSYVRTLGTRMITSEAQGKLGKGSIEARLQASKRDKLSFENDKINGPVESHGAVSALGSMAELGLLKQMDVFVLPSLILSPTLWGLKYQFYGNMRNEAKKGDFSAAATIAYGKRSESSDEVGELKFFSLDNTESLDIEIKHNELGLIGGYRWRDDLLQYANAIYVNQEASGVVTTQSGALSKSRYKYELNGTIFSTGLAYYFAKAHVKLDYSHFVSRWTHSRKDTINTFNAGIGFNW